MASRCHTDASIRCEDKQRCRTYAFPKTITKNKRKQTTYYTRKAKLNFRQRHQQASHVKVRINNTQVNRRVSHGTRIKTPRHHKPAIFHKNSEGSEQSARSRGQSTIDRLSEDGLEGTRHLDESDTAIKISATAVCHSVHQPLQKAFLERGLPLHHYTITQTLIFLYRAMASLTCATKLTARGRKCFSSDRSLLISP